MKTFLLEHDGKIYSPTVHINKRGFYDNEVKELLKHEKYGDYNILCVEEELEKYGIYDIYDNCFGLDEEVWSYKLWYEAYCDNNINGFSLPITVNNNAEYREVLESKLKEYIEYLKRPAFVYEKGLLECVEQECAIILEVMDNLINKEEEIAENNISDMFQLFQGDEFIISDLDKSYAFRGIAPFHKLQNQGYEKEYDEMMDECLTFYRVRTRNKNDNKTVISSMEHMLHLPYSMKNRASSMRFSAAGLPGLYLGTTTYICSREVEWCDEDELYATVFMPNDKGKKMKILNLTISQALINGIYNRGIDKEGHRSKLQNAMLKIFPLVIATSFSVKNQEAIKYQYLLSQILMKVANKNGVDGIAYLSMKGEDEFQYPQGVNLAIPANDISEKNEYSEKCKGFEISTPVLFSGQEGKQRQSYINKVYKKYDSNDLESFSSKLKVDGKLQFYGDTRFGRFDDYLIEYFVSG